MEPSPKNQKFVPGWIVAIVLLLALSPFIIFFTDHCSTNDCTQSPQDKKGDGYSGTWINEPNVKINITLSRKHITGCGQYQYRTSIDTNNEYMVDCTADGKNWKRYIVWTSIDKVMGPYSVTD